MHPTRPFMVIINNAVEFVAQAVPVRVRRQVLHLCPASVDTAAATGLAANQTCCILAMVSFRAAN